MFSQNQPTGPIRSSNRYVRPFVVCCLLCVVPFPCVFLAWTESAFWWGSGPYGALKWSPKKEDVFRIALFFFFLRIQHFLAVVLPFIGFSTFRVFCIFQRFQRFLAFLALFSSFSTFQRLQHFFSLLFVSFFVAVLALFSNFSTFQHVQHFLTVLDLSAVLALFSSFSTFINFSTFQWFQHILEVFTLFAVSAPFLTPAKTKILVLQSASGKRFGVSRMWDFFLKQKSF